MPYVILISDLEHKDTYLYRENGKTVLFDTEYQAVNQKYVLLDTRDGKSRVYDIQYRRSRS